MWNPLRSASSALAFAVIILAASLPSTAQDEERAADETGSRVDESHLLQGRGGPLVDEDEQRAEQEREGRDATGSGACGRGLFLLRRHEGRESITGSVQVAALDRPKAP